MTPWILAYGPVGDRIAEDPFERAQAHAPRGWHVEGQVVPTWKGMRAAASGPNAVGMQRWVAVYAPTAREALDGLSSKMWAAIRSPASGPRNYRDLRP